MFGSRFHFKVFGKHKSMSCFGGLMTLITLVILAIFFYLFGQDFFYKKNPQVIQSGYLPQNYSTINLTEEKIIIPWRIEDVSSIPVDPTGILYPRIYYYTSERDPKTMEFVSYNVEYLDFFKCNATDIMVNNGELQLGSYYCINLTNKPIGGYWDGFCLLS